MRRADRLARLRKAVKNCIVRPDDVNAFRCTALADYERARADLVAVGASFTRVSVPKALENYTLILHEIRKVFDDRRAKSRSDRFSKGFAALYAAKEGETAMGEIGYYVRERFYDPSRGGRQKFRMDMIEVNFTGSSLSIVGLRDRHPELRYPKDKWFCQQVGKDVVARAEILAFASARQRKISGSNAPGTCLAGFSQASITPVGLSGRVEFEVWEDDLERRRYQASIS